MPEDVEKQIQEVLNKVRPFLQRDGGDVDFVGFRDGIVYVQMTGACNGCMLATDDITSGVEIILMEEVPGVIQVKTDDIPPDMLQDYENRKLEEYRAKQEEIFHAAKADEGNAEKKAEKK